MQLLVRCGNPNFTVFHKIILTPQHIDANSTVMWPTHTHTVAALKLCPDSAFPVHITIALTYGYTPRTVGKLAAGKCRATEIFTAAYRWIELRRLSLDSVSTSCTSDRHVS
jgi:hypothetical protein